MPARTPPARLFDLRIDWLAQYAPDSELYAPGRAEDVARALPRIDGYLGATAAAVLMLSRNAEDWESRPEPWKALGDLIARAEAEFSGRLLIGARDLARWRDDTDGLTWGVLGIGGLDHLARSAADLDRLRLLFARGLRVVQPVEGPSSPLGGSEFPGDDRGLTDLGREFLDLLPTLASLGRGPVLDVAGMGPRSIDDVLAWFESDETRPGRIGLMDSRGAAPRSGRPMADGDRLRRFRAVGGVVGLGVTPPWVASTEAFRAEIEALAAIPFRGREGYDGIAIATDSLARAATLAGFKDAPSIVQWVTRTFEPAEARAILRGNAESLFTS